MNFDRELYLSGFAKNLRTLRRAKGYTQERLSQESNISYKYMQELEAGNKCPSLVIIIRLCKALNVSVDRVVEGLTKTGIDQVQERANGQQ